MAEYPDWCDDPLEVTKKRNTVKDQVEQISQYHLAAVTCPCSRTVFIDSAYRCIECGVWYCRTCALKHFGYEVFNDKVVKVEEARSQRILSELTAEAQEMGLYD